MKTAAIIAEYNPFHNGHRYQIEQTKKLTGADCILVVMSGDFVQRGAPALCNKYIRAEMALLNGADAVLELPALYAVSSAEYFAQGSVCLLNSLGAVDILSFGSESGDISLIRSLAKELISHSASYDAEIRRLLKEGLSFPAARQKAAASLCSSEALMKEPNNILGLEYCKALYASESTIAPFTLKRAGSGYHNPSLPSLLEEAPFCSASAVRDALTKNRGAKLASHVPESVYNLLKKQQLFKNHMRADDFSALLHYKLISEKESGFDGYLDCSPDISEKICKNLGSFTTFSDFCGLLKSKDLTYTRISRILLHILLGLTVPECFLPAFTERLLPVSYARLLGFRRDCAPLLSHIKKNSSIPLISKLADAPALLDKEALSLLRFDIRCSDIYEAVYFHKTGEAPLNEYRQSPIIL